MNGVNILTDPRWSERASRSRGAARGGYPGHKNRRPGKQEENWTHKADIVKIWVDSRDGKYKKLTQELYGAVIDEAHKRRLRVTAHIFELEDAKGLIRAGVDVFAHGIRDKDIDEELVAMFKHTSEL